MFRPISVLLLVLCVLGLGVLHAQPQGQPQGQPAKTPPSQGQQPPQPQGAPPAQTPPPAAGTDQQPTPTFRTGINYVRVDAIVTDKKGDMVLDLKQGDFDVTEDNKPQSIDSFKLIQVTGKPAEGETPREIRSEYVLETEAQRDDVRLFVIFLDDYHVRLGNSMVVRAPLVRFLQNQVGPMDLVGIMTPLMPFDAINFTRNRDATIAAIEHFVGRKYDYKPLNEFEEKYAYYPVETVEQVRNQVSMSAIRSLVGGLATMREGRKSLILVSEGYSNYVPPQMRDQSAQYPGSGNPNRNNPFAGENNMNEDRYRFSQQVDMLSDIREIFSNANRANTSIYSLDPRGLAVFEHDINEGVGTGVDASSLKETQDSLRVLSDETDGRAIVNMNDLDKGLKQMVKDSTAYYLIGYNSSQAPADGRFHEIKVKVKRPGVTVRARKGYFALTKEEMSRAMTPLSMKPVADPQLTKAMEAVEAPARARTIRTWIGTNRAADGKTNLTFVWEPVPQPPGTTNVERREPATRVTLTAAPASGSMVRKRVPDPADTGASTGTPVATNGGSSPTTNPSLPASASTAPSTGAATAKSTGGHLTFEVPPGNLSLKLSVEGAAGQVLDSDFRDLVVPDYSKEPISEPAIYRARTQRDLQTVLADSNAVPTATREFSRTEKLVVRFNAYNPAPPTVELLNANGKKMADVPAKAFDGAGTNGFQAELPLAALPTGDFFIAVKSAEARRVVAFRISG